MATPNKLKKLADEKGEPAVEVVLRVLNEEITLQRAACVLGIAEANLSRWASKNGIQRKTTVRWELDTKQS